MKGIDYLYPLTLFTDVKPLNIFSTNYDLTIERLCFLKNIGYTDGFDPYWNKDLFLESGKNKEVNILKLHGSVNWYRTELGDYFSIPIQSKDMDIQFVSGEKGIPLILYPGTKLRYIEPVLEILTILRESLLKAKSCFVVGYSFKDDHITKLFKYAARINRNLILFFISPSAHEIYYEKLKRHTDEEFIHGFTHEGFSPRFNIDRPSELEGRVICLPYRFQKIFPKLKKYYENLQIGLNLESIIYDKKESGKFFELNELYNLDSSKENSPLDESSEYITVVDCLRFFMECEYFEKCQKIIDDCGGWNEIMIKDPKITLELLLKFTLNYKHYSNHKYFDILKDYLELRNEKLTFDIKPDSIVTYFNINYKGRPIIGSGSYDLFSSLLEIIHKSLEISSENTLEIEGMINNWRKIFRKWENSSINIFEYMKNYIPEEYSRTF